MSEFYHQYDDLELLIDHPIFNEITALQYKLEGERFSSRQEAIDEIDPYLRLLHGVASDQELLGKEVQLPGEAIHTPHCTLDLRTDMPDFSTKIVSASDEYIADESPIHGEYAGIHPIITLAGDNTHRVDLHHHVTIGSGASYGVFMGQMAVHGSVSSSHLEFIDDKHAIQFVNALNILVDASHDEQTAATTAELHDLLTPEHEGDVFDPYRLRKVGRAVRQLEENRQAIDLKYRDGVIDLVGAKIGIHRTTKFAVQAINGCLKYPLPNKNIFTENEIDGTLTLQGLEFTPYYFKHKKGTMYYSEDSDMLSIVTNGFNANREPAPLYIPLEKLRMFYPVS